MALNFPNRRQDGSPLQIGDEYTGGNSVNYIWDGHKWVGHAPSSSFGNSSIINNGHVVQVTPDGNLTIPVGAQIIDDLGNPVHLSAASWQITTGSVALSLLADGTLSFPNNTIKTNSPNLEIQLGTTTDPYWITEYGGFGSNPQNAQAYGTGAVYDSKGNLYVIGAVGSDTTSFLISSLMLKYDPDGNLLWHKTWQDPINGGNCGADNVAIAIDANDRIYWVANDWNVGGMWTGYFDTDGNIGLGGTAQQALGINNLFPSDLACDNLGNYYISGLVNPGIPFIVKINGNTAAIEWTSDTTPKDSFNNDTTGVYRAITVNTSTGDVFAIGDYIDDGQWAMLSKWNADGVHQWTNKLVTIVGDIGEAVVFNNGYVYTIVNDLAEYKTVVSKFSTDGVLVWAADLTVGGGFGYDLSFDADYNVYITGIALDQLLLTKLNPTTGQVIYSRAVVTTGGSIIFDGWQDPLTGHRVGDIYQDKIAITAMTTADIIDGTTSTPKIIVAQLPIDGSIVGEFENVLVSDVTADVVASSSVVSYSVTPLDWPTDTIGTSISSLSQLSANAATIVGGHSSKTIGIGSGVRSTNWNFGADGTLAFPDGSVQSTAYVGGTAGGTAGLGKFVIVDDPYQAILSTTGTGYDIVIAASQGEGAQYISIPNNENAALGNNLIIGTSTATSAVRIWSDTSAWTFGTDGNLTIPGDIHKTTDVSIVVGSQPIENVEIFQADTTTDGVPELVWRMFVLSGIYPDLGDFVTSGTTVTTGWGTPVTATIQQVIKDIGAGYWVFIFNQDIVTGFSSGPKRATFNLGLQTWTFGTTGTLTIPATGDILRNGISAFTGGGGGASNGWELSSSTALLSLASNGTLTLSGDTPTINGVSTGTDVNIIASDGETTSTWVFGADGALTLPNGTAIGSYDTPNGVDIKAFANNDYAQLNYNEDQYVWVEGDGAYIGTNWGAGPGNNKLWIFDKSGTLTLPTTRALGNMLFDAEWNGDANALIQNNGLTVNATTLLTVEEPSILTTYAIAVDTKVMFSITVDRLANNTGGWNGIGVGIHDVSVIATYLGADRTKSVGFYEDGDYYGDFNGFNGPSGYISGDVVDVAVDRASNLIWVRVNGGNWNAGGGADPATGTGGYILPAFEGADIYPGVTPTNQGSSDPGNEFTINITAAYTVPTGFTFAGTGATPPSLIFPDGSEQYTAWTGVNISTVAPTTTGTTGALWYDTVEGRLYTNIGTSWVDASPTIIPPPETYLDKIQIDGSTLTVSDYSWTFGEDGMFSGPNDILKVPGDIQDANGSVIRVATTSTAPTRVDGQLWYDSQEGRTYIKYNNQWVDSSPTVIPPPSTYLEDLTIDGDDLYDANGSVIRVAAEATAPTRVNGQLWFDTVEGRAYIKYNDQWVDLNPPVIPPPSTYLGDIEVDGSTLHINNSTLTIDATGTLLVNGATYIPSDTYEYKYQPVRYLSTASVVNTAYFVTKDNHGQAGFKNVLHTGKFIFSIEDQNGKSMHRLLDQMTDRGLETILTVKDSGQEVAKFITGETSEYYENDYTPYRGFIVSIGRMWGSEPHKAKLVFSAEGYPNLSIDTTVSSDTFTVSSLTPYEGTVGMVVVYGTGTEPLSKIDLWEFAKSIIDNIIYGIFGINNPTDIRSAFYSNIDTIIGATLPKDSLYPHLEFYDGSNYLTIESVNSTVTSSTGTDAAFDIKFDTEHYFITTNNLRDLVGVNYQVGDTFLADGTLFGGTSIVNDCLITVTLVNNEGRPLDVSVTGTPNPAAVVWPIDNIEDGGDDQEDNGNYIYTNVSGFTYNSGSQGTGAIPYAGGEISDGTNYFGAGSQYVVTYKSSVFGIWAIGSTITSIGTDGNSGFDGNGVARAENLSPATYYQVQALPINGSGYWSTNATYTISLDLNGYTGSQGFNNGVYRLDYYGDSLIANSELNIATRGPDNLYLYTNDNGYSNQSYLGLLHNDAIELYTSNSIGGSNEFNWRFDNKGVLELPGTLKLPGSYIVGETKAQINGDHKVVLSISSSSYISNNVIQDIEVDVFSTPGVVYSGTATYGIFYIGFDRDGNYFIAASQLAAPPTYEPTGWVDGEQVFIPGTVFGGTSPANDCTATLSLQIYGGGPYNYSASWTTQGTNPYQAKLFTFNYDGSITFPDGQVQTTAWTGTTVAPSLGNFAFSGDTLSNTLSDASTLQVGGNSWIFGSSGQLTFPDATVQTTAWTGTSVLVNGTYTVALSTTGQLNLPSAANTESSNARIQSANSIDILSNLSKWTFSSTGTITFPNSTVQTTAYVAANVVNKTSGSWTLNTGANTVSITVAPGNNYQMWVNGTCDNGIVEWNATVNVSNTNVPVVGSQYGWYYAAGNMLVLTSMPNQIVGTAGSISTATVATTASNVLKFGITNNSGSTQTVYWGYTTL